MEISNGQNSEGSLFTTSTHLPSASVITETCGVFITRGSGKGGDHSVLLEGTRYYHLLFVYSNISISPSSRNSPTIFKQHLSSDSYKRLRPFWKPISIQRLENCSPSFKKVERGGGGGGTGEVQQRQLQQTTTTKTFSCIILAHEMTKKRY